MRVYWTHIFSILSLVFLIGIAYPVHAGGPAHSTQNEASSILDQALQDIQQNTQPSPTPNLIEQAPPPVEEALTFEPEPEVQEVPAVVAEPPQFETVSEPEPASIAAETLIEPAPDDRVINVQDNSSFFGLSVGLYDALKGDDLAATLGLEWQPGVKIAGLIKPLFGALVTTDGSFLGYGGLGLPIQLNRKWLIQPSVSVGYYEEGDGFDLGRRLAYRVGSEIAYVFDNQSRLGLNIHTITNGTSIDTDDRTEVISLVYTTPLRNVPGFRQR